jgi:light-regulated signal transduction histidine kinase (bacteriophytochrome)
MVDVDSDLVKLCTQLFRDLRSPVIALAGFARLIRDGHAGPTTQQQREFLDDVLTSAEQLMSVIDKSENDARALIHKSSEGQNQTG